MSLCNQTLELPKCSVEASFLLLIPKTIIVLLEVFQKCLRIFINFSEREKISRWRWSGRSRLPTEQGAQCSAQTQDSEIMTWPEGRGLPDWATQCPYSILSSNRTSKCELIHSSHEVAMKMSHQTNHRHACLLHVEWLSYTLIRLETETLYLLYYFNVLANRNVTAILDRCLWYIIGWRNPNQ